MNHTVKLSPKRWLVLLTVFLLSLTSTFSYLSFGPINNIVVPYFNINYTDSDWIVLSTYISGTVFLPLLAWYSFTEQLNLRLLLLVSSATYLLDCVFSIVSFVKPNLFALIILGQFSVGFLQSAYSLFPGSVATTWFPENQIGVVTGIITMGWNAGMLLSELLLENVLRNPPRLNSSTSLTTETNASWFWFDEVTFVTTYSILLTLAFAVFTSVLVAIPALPEYPPSVSQAVKRLTPSQRSSTTYKLFFVEIKGLLKDFTFVQIQLIHCLCVQTYVLETLIMQEVVVSIQPLLDIQKSSAMISGYILACRSVGDIIGSVIGGKTLDVYRKYRLQTIAGTGLAFVVIFGLLVSYHFASFIGLCFSMFLLGTCSTIGYLSIYDSVLQHTFPRNMILVLSVAGSLRVCITIVVSEIGRLFLHFTGPYGVLVYHCVLQLVGFLLSVVVKPGLKRSTTEQKHSQDYNNAVNNVETTPILNN